ncbi:hypothetical protein ACET3X_001982 [Alternaria dauci]|uniref:Uncharacterized protein n=1 Tax=Alternaria dauci TaxID=48095 RepID=A0ABR3UZA4_9PLEO
MPYLETRIRHLLCASRDDKGEGEAINRYNTVRLFPPPDDKLTTLNWGKEKYKYEFRPLPCQNDPVIREIVRLIRALNLKDMEFANMRFRVSPTDESAPFWLALPDYSTYCSKLYTFVDDYEEFPLTAWVNFCPGLPGPIADNLYLKIGTKWVLLKDWLLSSYKSIYRFSDPDGLVGEKGYRAQRKWWRVNGKPFRLFDLPAEVRMTLFEFALGPRIYPLDESSSDSVRLGVGFANYLDTTVRGYQTVTGCSAHEPNIALLSINRQMHTEALQAGWENTRKCFFSPDRFDFVLDSSMRPKYNWLNHPILDFTMEGWFQVLDLETRPHFHKRNSKTFGTLVSKLNKLSTLQLWFRSPDDGSSFYPHAIRNILHDTSIHNANNTDGRIICCQRIMVDWIMTFAWPHVKDLHARVTVGGILEKNTKDKWNELLALSAENKLHAIDQEATEQAILDSPLALP